MESITGIEPPPRANYIRVIMAELERLHSHVLWAGIAGKLMGFKTMFMTCFAIREKVMDVLEAISGNRVNYAMNRIGGVNRDIADPDAILRMVDALEREMVHTVIPVFTTNRTALSRCEGIGVLTRERAQACGAVGPYRKSFGAAAGSAPRRTVCGISRDGIRCAGRNRRRRESPARGQGARNHRELPHSSPGTGQTSGG